MPEEKTLPGSWFPIFTTHATRRTSNNNTTYFNSHKTNTSSNSNGNLITHTKNHTTSNAIITNQKNSNHNTPTEMEPQSNHHGGCLGSSNSNTNSPSPHHMDGIVISESAIHGKGAYIQRMQYIPMNGYGKRLGVKETLILNLE